MTAEHGGGSLPQKDSLAAVLELRGAAPRSAVAAERKLLSALPEFVRDLARLLVPLHDPLAGRRFDAVALLLKYP